MDRNSLKFKTLRNVFFNMLGTGWPIILSIFITPIIVLNLGVKDYGIYIFVSTTVSFLGLLNLGMGTAAAKQISYYSGKKDFDSLKKTIYTINFFFLLVSIAGLIISALIYFFGAQILPDKFMSYEKYLALFVIAGVVFFIENITRIFPTSLVSMQRFDINSKLGILSISLTMISTLLIALYTKNLYHIFLSQIFINLLIGIIAFRPTQKMFDFPMLKIKMDRQELKLLYKFGIATVISDTANALLSYLDKLIIPLFVGPSNLTYYNMPGSIASKIPSVSGSMAGVIFPMASQLEGEQKTDQIKTLYLKSTRLITLVSAAISITTISFAYQIMRFWLNIDFAEKTTNILILLVITNFILSLYSPIVNFLFGLNKLKVLIYSNFFMAIVNIILLIILLPKYGILGAAIAYLISVIPIVFIIIYTEQKILHLQNRSNYYIKTILGILVTGLVVFLINKIILSQITVNLLMLLIVSGISFLFYIFLYKILGFLNKEDSNDISAFTKTVFNSLKR